MPPPRREDLWNSGKDETVEVNQRALIDKILARYSGEHTIFRELLQNADDAGAEHVQVKFYSRVGIDAQDKGEGTSRLPDAKKDLIHRYVVSNDGIPFRTQDWQRLKKIAEGNPDEEKIGAFGVGFYSLWSVCDDPFVESGDKWMGFYWKDGKDQLLARSGDLPASDAGAKAESTSTGHPWTTFTMALREPAVLEEPLDLARFFITSLTFMRTVKKIDMLVDDIKVLQVEKRTKSRQKVSKKGLRNSSPNAMMTVQGVEETASVIDAQVMHWLADTGFTPPSLPPPMQAVAKAGKSFTSIFSSSFFSRSSAAPVSTPSPQPIEPPQDPQGVTKLSREIQIYQADIKVVVSTAFGRELERATKKQAPSRMPASLVFSRGEEDELSAGNGSANQGKSARNAAAVFSGLIPALDSEKGARVFIGQATSQTTGIGGHLAARFIPTVERESIDLVDRHVSHWNRELLWVGGYLGRLIYELELQTLAQQWAQTSIQDTAIRAKITAQALHALRFFSFSPSTPSAVVSQEMEVAFFGCATDNQAFPLVSSSGILPVSGVRLPDPDLQKFLPDLPVIHQSALDEAKRPVARLRERSLLRNVTFEDVVKQLNLRPLTEAEMVDCLKWWQTMSSLEGQANQARSRFLNAAILVQENGKILPLSMIETVIKPQSSSISTDMPLPPHTMPYNITRDLKGSTVFSVFGWTELSMLQYITFLISPPLSNASDSDVNTDIRQSPAFAEKVLAMLGRAWQSIASNQQTAIANELKEVACMPTKAGFKKPGEAYFEKNLLFEDLPTISLPKNTAIKGGMEKMLLSIGVRKTVDLQLVFSRLVGGGSWTCQDLMKYLVSVKDTLSTEELARLKQTAAFPLETESQQDGTKAPIARRKPHQLYEPVDAMRGLGLPVLDWGDLKWRSSSDEAKMLFGLGLRRFPPVDVLLGIATGPAPTNSKALLYLLQNIHTHYVGFDPSQYSNVAFIPARSAKGEEILATPGDVYTNSACAILGFNIAYAFVALPENAQKLRIAPDPPMERLIQALITPPTRDLGKAKTIFEYMATQLGQSSLSNASRLINQAVIPVKKADNVGLYKPAEVYFSSKDSNQLYSSAFTFVDFGEKANLFLRYCGVRSEPSIKDIATLLMQEPERMLKQAGTPEKYLEQLRLLAANWSTFDSTMRAQMKQSSFLLASQRVPVKRKGAKLLAFGGGDDEFEREWVLSRAPEIAIVDSITMLQYFGQHILAAPEEHLLENFYEHLGAQPVSSLVRTEYVPHGPSPNVSDQAKALRRHVLERLTIFLAEARRNKSDWTVEGLNKEGTFVVQEVRDLKARYTYHGAGKNIQHHETLYATAHKIKNTRAIQLTVSQTAQPDDYDIAAALCGILLKSPKADDALLLYSILSTPLMALKKRGFNVDRILNQQREEKLRLQNEAVREREKAAVEAARIPSSPILPQPVSASARDDQSITTESSDTAVTSGAPDGKSESGKRKGLFNRFRRDSKGNGPGMPGMPGSLPGVGGMGLPNLPGLSGAGIGAGAGAGPMAGGGLGGAGNVSTKRPTDLNTIRNTVQTAINASRPETGTQVQNSRQAVQDVSESQNQYCDTSAEADIVLAVDPGRTGLKIWVPRDVAGESHAFLQSKMDTCMQFAQEILMPIGQTYRLASEVLNIFWDHEGPLIAFNRNGSIFCNARYFAAWHAEQCRGGQRVDALISWYFSVAHELAHNLESAHNSSHEFYFSSIAEEYLMRFTPMLAR